MSRFEVGQTVAFVRSRSGGPLPIPQRAVVGSVSATGRVTLAGIGEVFNANGHLRGRDRWDYTHIAPWSDEHSLARREGLARMLRRTIAGLGSADDAELMVAMSDALDARKKAAKDEEAVR